MAATEGIQPLPVVFDLSCPIALPERPSQIHWPWPVAGPSSLNEDPATFLRRRYLETLYVGEPIFPLSGLASDLARIDVGVLSPLLPEYALGLEGIEARYRTRLLPALKVAVAGGDATDELEDAGVDTDEVQTLLAGVELRTKCRTAVEGSRFVTSKTLVEEYEQSEVLIQLLLLLFRRRAERQTDLMAKQTDTDMALELLADRIGVWHAVADLDIGLDMDGPPTSGGKEEGERGIQSRLRRFWKECLLPHFLSSEAKYLSSWHHKVFGIPIPPELVPVKKPRKPKVTRRLSVESHPAPSMSRTESSSSRKRGRDSTGTTGWRDGMGGHSRRSSTDRSVGQSLAESLAEEREKRPSFRRSQSALSTTSQEGGRRIIRAPSGRDLFKGREVSMLKRTSSQKIQRTASLSTTGLLGRTIDTSASQSQSQSESQSQLRAGNGREYRRVQSQREVREKDPDTLVYATPSKPRGNGLFGFAHPTPIREEPSSGSRYESHPFVAETPTANRVAETPMGNRIAETPMLNRVAETPLSARLHAVAATKVAGTPTPRRVALTSVAETPVAGVAETPVGRKRGWVEETPSRSRGRYAVDETPSRSTSRRSYYDSGSPLRGSDDEFAGLMVPTDDEESPLKRH